MTAAWERALSFWGLAIQKDAPKLDPRAEGLAFIDLASRELTVNTKRLADLKAEGSLPAVFAHELGHHVRYPHSLSTQARLELLEKEILPFRGYSLLNLFTDYLINTELAREKDFLSPDGGRLPGTPAPAEAMEQDPAFWFYLTCFEEAWGLEPHTLTREAGEALERKFPGARAEAQLLAQEVPNLAPNLFTQFLYFASVVSRYQLVDQEKDGPGDGKSLNPGHGDYSRPSAGDYADALERTAAESEAIRKAIEKGWLKPERVGDTEASRQQRAAGLPGVLAGEPRKLAEAMAIRYRRLAERHLVPSPRERRAGDPLRPVDAFRVGPGRLAAGDRLDRLDPRAGPGPGRGRAPPPRPPPRRRRRGGRGAPRPARDLPRRQRLDARPEGDAQPDDARGAGPRDVRDPRAEGRSAR